MRSWLLRFWRDETFFVACVRSAVFLAGQMVAMGVIPTGIPGAGRWVGAFIAAASLLFAAGNKTPTDADGFAKINPKIEIPPVPTEHKTVTPSGGGTGA